MAHEPLDTLYIYSGVIERGAIRMPEHMSGYMVDHLNFGPRA